MFFRCLLLLVAGLTLPLGAEPAPAFSPVDGPVVPTGSATQKRVVVIPVEGEIASPVLYILRRGLKEAIDEKADAVVLDMKTPGGALDVTFEIMEALGKFPGETVTYVNNEAISAGAFISAMTGEIWFAPDGIIGAAAPVSGTGQDVDATMKMKIVSYLKARLRSISEGKGYRGQVISAMVDSDYELKIEGEVLKSKGELLSLTATESAKTYGDPARARGGKGRIMNAIALLFFVGVILLAAEVFVPGGVLGIIGGLAMAAGCGVAFAKLGVAGGSVATVAASLLLGLTVYIELILLPKTRLGKSMIVQTSVDGTSQPPVATAAIIGQSAEAETALMPTGFVLVEGRRYEAFCPAGHVAKGAALRVTGLDNFRLIVIKT